MHSAYRSHPIFIGYVHGSYLLKEFTLDVRTFVTFIVIYNEVYFFCHHKLLCIYTNY